MMPLLWSVARRFACLMPPLSAAVLRALSATLGLGLALSGATQAAEETAAAPSAPAASSDAPPPLPHFPLAAPARAERALDQALPPLPQDRLVEKPLWELGVGAAMLHWPDYRGADHGQNHLLPLPFFVYRGDFLRADKGGARAVFIEGDRVEVDISVNGSAPVRTDPDGARAGMADLPPTVEVGPNLNVHLWKATDGRASLDLRVPVRFAIRLKSPYRSIGVVTTPKLNLDLARLAGGWNVGLLAGPVFGSKRYHAHYYGVSAEEATATRPAYEARAGYAGWHAIASTSRRFQNTWLAAYVRHDRLGGAVFEDSPLVRRKSDWSFGLGVAWVLKSSERTVLVPE